MAKQVLLNKFNFRKLGSIDIFDLRKLYLTKIAPIKDFDNFYDASQTYFYGKVDFSGNIVYLSEKYLSTLPNSNKNSNETFYALNFVSDAFRDFRNYYEKAVKVGILSSNENNLTLIDPLKGWESMHIMHGNIIEDSYSVLINSYLEAPSEFNGIEMARPINFDDFINSFKHMFRSKGSKFKLSRSSFISSRHCPLSTTGLVIEVTPSIGYSNDDQKRDIMNNPNFKFYMNSLKKFGFMADLDYPSRIIADIGSAPMQTYMANYGITFDNIFDQIYYKANDYDYDIIKIYISQFYNSYAFRYPFKTVIESESVSHPMHRKYKRSSKFRINKGNGVIKRSGFIKNRCLTRKRHQRQVLTESEFQNKYNDDYWLPFYIEFLNYELSNPLDEHVLAKTIKNAKDLKKNIDMNTAMRYINEKMNFYRYPVSILSLENFKYNTKSKTIQKSEAASTTTADTGATDTGTTGVTTSGGGSSGGGY